jgi:hypothetical protein
VFELSTAAAWTRIVTTDGRYRHRAALAAVGSSAFFGIFGKGILRGDMRSPIHWAEEELEANSARGMSSIAAYGPGLDHGDDEPLLPVECLRHTHRRT